MSLSWRAVMLLGSSAFALLAGCGDPTSPGGTIVAPTGLAATELPSGDIDLTWQDNSTDESGFELQRSTTGPGGSYATVAALGPNVADFVDAQVDGVTQYCYRVRAIGGTGTTPSAYTTPACHQSTAPAAPSALAATPTFGQVDLTWADNSDDESGFEVWTSTVGAGGTFALLVTVGADVAAYSQTGLEDATEYCYRVRAVGPKGQTSQFTSTACATTPVPTSPPPGAPTNLTAAVSAATTISLGWTDHASDEQGFEIWRSTTGPTGVYAPVATVGVNVTDADDPGLTAGAQYCYQVRALGGGNAPPSDFSNTSCAAAPAAPTAPSGLAASPTSGTAVQLTWSDNSADEQRFEVWRSTTGPAGTYSLLTTVDANTTSADDTGLTSGDEYCYQVRATGAGFAPASDFSAGACATPPTPPAAPSQLAATATSSATVALAWTDNSSDEGGFEIRRSTAGSSGTYTIIDTVAANVTAATDANVTSSKQYCYKVRALGAGATGPSGLSNFSCITTPPATPSALQATATTPSRISTTWQDNSSDEAGFEVWRSTTGIGGTYTLRSTRGVGIESFNDTGLNSATEYCYEVRATGSGSGVPDSPFAGPVCTTTPLLVRVVLFGDSNTDLCADHQASSDPLRFTSYVSVKPALSPSDQHLSCSVAFKVESAWNAIRPESVLVVNHGIGGTTTGGLGGAGDAVRTPKSAPNARASVGGTTRFQAEVLGVQAPNWSGGETNTTWFPNGPVTRVNAYLPNANDFAYVSMGTNDDAGPTRTLTAQATADNLRWMIQGWLDAGHRADHFIVTTLAPRTDGTLNSPTAIPDRNDFIRALASELGVHLIDLAAHVSDDNGATWLDPSLHIGDGVHYSETVRGWVGDQVASWMSAEAPPLP